MDESVCQVSTRVTEFGALGHCHRLWMCQGAGVSKWVGEAAKRRGVTYSRKNMEKIDIPVTPKDSESRFVMW